MNALMTVREKQQADELARLQVEVERLRRWLTMDVRERLAEHLLSIAELLADGRTAILRPPTQEALAEAIGSGRESVSRSLAAMEREGLIRRKGTGIWRASITLTAEFIAAVEAQGADQGAA